MRIRDWPSGERPREKLFARGPTALSDAELLAIFLGSGVRGQDAVSTARTLLASHGPLRALLERSPAELSKLPGIGPARASRLASALELCNRFLAAGLERGQALTDPKAAGLYFTQRLRSHPHEVFAALFLDTRHRALAFEELFRGTIDGAEVHPREVVRRALAHNAAALIVALPATWHGSDMTLSLAPLHFPTICRCHRDDAHSGDKSVGFVTTVERVDRP